jgi:phospholipase C
LIDLIRKSPLWKDTAVIVTYDENGGMWDHVAPPKGDRWGPGTRVPAILVSPFAKRGFVDHTVMDTTAIAKLIETRFGLQPLGSRDATSPDMTQAFDFGE